MELKEFLKLQREIDNSPDERAWERVEKLTGKIPCEYKTWLEAVEYLTLRRLEEGQIGYLAHLLGSPSNALYLAVKTGNLSLVKYYIEQKCPVTQKCYWRAMDKFSIFKHVHNASDPRLILSLNTISNDVKLLRFLLDFYSSGGLALLGCFNHLLRLIYTYVSPETRLKLKLKDVWTRQMGLPINAINIPDPVEFTIPLKRLRLGELTSEEVKIMRLWKIPDLDAELDRYYPV